MGYSTALYEAEKESGVRRESGAKNLKKLSPKHLQVIRLHIDGYKGSEIAQAMGMTDATVSNILSDPLSKAILQRVYDQHQLEFQALYGKVVDTVRDGLDREDMETRLKAIDRYVKVKQVHEAKDEAETAEDVISRLLNVVQVNVQVNGGGQSND